MDKPDISFNRRKFLIGSGSLLAGATAYSITPNFLWAETVELSDLSHLIYSVFPHKSVPRKYYKATAQGLLDKASNDDNLKKILDDGIAMANSIFGKPYRRLSSKKKEMAMDRLRPTDFYSTLRGHAVVAFYNTQEIWPYFGYPGSSYEFGGYIDRGVGDIFWLE